jgi:hypothetical protein
MISKPAEIVLVPPTEEELRQQRLKAGIQALRSGKYKQNRGEIRSRDGSMCVIGVMLDANGAGPDDYYHTFREWFGLEPSQVWLLNDRGCTFPVIADYLEAEYVR